MNRYYKVDLCDGYRELLSEEQFNKDFTPSELLEIIQDENNIIYLTEYNDRQVKRCEKYKNDESFMDRFEESKGYVPSILDLLEHYYG